MDRVRCHCPDGSCMLCDDEGMIPLDPAEDAHVDVDTPEPINNANRLSGPSLWPWEPS